MSGIKISGEKRLVVVSGRAHPQLAVDIASELGTELVETDARTFANGEIYARFGESIRGTDVFIIQSHCSPINEWVMEQLIMVDAAKRASAKRITVVAPFYPYARQDKKGQGREPISARLIADLYKAAGADRIMSVDLHAAQIQGFFDGPVDHLFAMPVLLEHFRSRINPETLTIVKAAEALKARGAKSVTVGATHAVFSDPAVEILQSDFIDQVVVTDTLPLGDEKRWDRLTVLPIAPLIARAIHEVFDDGSVTSMFDGAA